MRITLLFLGLIGLLVSLFVLLNPTVVLYLFMGSTNVNYEIATDINDTISFNFNKNYIKDYYVIDSTEKEYLNYINIYSEQLALSNTTENITFMKVNDNIYYPENLSYQYALVIEEDTLNVENQTIEFEKTDNLTIDKISINYVGIDYYEAETYNMIAYALMILLFIFSLLLILMSTGI